MLFLKMKILSSSGWKDDKSTDPSDLDLKLHCISKKDIDNVLDRLGSL